MIKYVCYSYNNIQDLLISSRLNDLTVRPSLLYVDYNC